MTYPAFNSGDILTASDMNAVGLWRVTGCTTSSVGGTAATASNGVVTIGTSNTSVTVDNAFSASFANYRIIISGGQSSANGSIALQLLNSTGSTYQIYGYFGNFGSTALNGYGPAANTRWTDAILAATSRYHAIIDLINPFATQQTFGYSNSSSTVGCYNFSLVDTASVSNTGFTISPLSGTITGGTIRVYGYNN